MPKLKSKPSSAKKTKSKLTAKASSKKTLKSAGKLRAKPKTRLKKRIPLVSKTKTKKKVSAKTTTKRKLKIVSKVKSKFTPKTKTLAKNLKHPIQLTDLQKAELVATIEKIVNLRKGTREGLKSFDEIDRILDKYNQRYTNVPAKFDAILNFGKEKDPRILHDHVFMAIKNKDAEAIELYTLLCLLGEGKTNFDYAKEKMLSLFKKSLEAKNKQHLHEI